jgi:Cof subfamily protein (haloacid dehalogenase superfamily)
MIKFLPKLAFFDIDGTLLGDTHTLSKRTINAIADLRARGTQIALATGRPSFGASNISKELGIDCFSLFFSGSLISNPKSKQILFKAKIDKDLIYKTISVTKELGLYLEFYTEDNYFVEKFTEITPIHTHYMGFDPEIADFEKLAEEAEIIKLLVATVGQHDKQQMLIEAIPELNCLCSTGANHPDIIFNNITSKSANRTDGFTRILSSLKIEAKDVISFGDAKSDLEFIDLSGCGVAMQNAHEDLKKAADLITDSANNDGVAKVIEQILQNNP